MAGFLQLMSGPKGFEWNVSPEIFSIGFFTLRWYSLMFIISFLLGYYIVQRIYQEEGKPDEYMEALFYFVFAGTIIGARLGHCLFYEPGYYLANPLEILKIWHGGLASHGAAIGILSAIYLYARSRKGITFFWTVDRVVIVVALSGFFIRLGNLFNSEIVGSVTDVPWAFLFPRHEANPLPRHPAQIYEALAYLAIFFILYRTYQAKKARTEPGLLLGMFLFMVFGFRFFVEFFKEVQTPWENALPLTMGQFLSIPFVLIGLYLYYRAKQAPPVEVAPPPKPAPRKKKKR